MKLDLPILNIRKNPIFLTDCYNLSHQNLKCNTDWEISHMYNRSKGMILYGLAETIAAVLSVQITEEMVHEAYEKAEAMGLPFPIDLWLRVVREFNGYAPLKIESLREGTWSPIGTPFAQITNTEQGFGELVTWWEGVFMKAYFASGCATEAFLMKKYLLEEQAKGGYDDSFLWKIHSFGYRGHRSEEDAYYASTAWNLSLHGTDDFVSARFSPKAKIGSISALAHKVVQQFDNELDCFKFAIDRTKEIGKNIVALVIDTYNANRVIQEYLPILAVYAAERGIHIVLRPDSGDVIGQAMFIYRIARQENNFMNVSVIIGEGMSFDVVKDYDSVLKKKGIPLNFVFYGVGGGFYNHINRDYLGWAMKTAYSNGSNRMKFSEVEIKRSIPGKVVLVRDEQNNLIVDYNVGSNQVDQYVTIYYHDRERTEPYFYVPKFEETKEIVEQQTAKQERIILSDTIKAEIKKFEELYRG
jgi:nicotinic acid phosphoribosyltransferase